MLHPLYSNKKNKESQSKHHYAVIGWYLGFLIIIPLVIRNLYSFDTLRFYFPIIDLIANSFSASGGSNNLFKDLYSLSPNNIISFLSTNFINLIALIGVSWNGILYAFQHNSVLAGVVVTIFMYVITYLIPTQMIPYVVKRVESKVHQYKMAEFDITIFNRRIHLEDYIVSLIVIIMLVVIEFFFVSTYIKFIKDV